jgi:hypothetical protein
MVDARWQFRVLYRNFLTCVIDLQFLPNPGDIQKLGIQLMAALSAFGLVVAIYEVPRYSFSGLPPERLAIAAWGDQEFVIATTMAVAGLLAVLAWNSILPAREDALVLGPLPVHTRAVGLARIGAVASVLGMSVAALNVFTGISFPFVWIPPGGNLLRSLAAYWLTVAAAGTFVFCALLALQGLAALILTHRLFLRVSSALQLVSFFTILSVYFLKPPLASPRALNAPENHKWLAALPSYWFLGLFQELNGSTHPAFAALAVRSLGLLALAAFLAAGTLALAYRRSLRRLVEEPDIVPSERVRPVARFTTRVAVLLMPRPLERAILLFAARTLARSRQHRLLFIAYASVGLAIAFAYARSYLYGNAESPWSRPNVPFVAASVAILLMAVIGARAVFALPASQPSSWVFRLTAVHRPALYFRAVRKSLFVLVAAPVWIGCAIVYLTLWPARPALEHLALLATLSVLLVERALHRFRKIPFACSYLPGRANLHVKVYAFGALFLFLADSGSRLEFWAMERSVRFAILLGAILVLAIWTRRRTAEFANAPGNRIQFEDLPQSDIFALDLRPDGAWLSDDAYVAAIDLRAQRKAARR